MERLFRNNENKGAKFGLQFRPGVGTFENCVAFGQEGGGASAGGRLNGSTIAMDASPMPSPLDKDCPLDHQEVEFAASMQGLMHQALTLFLMLPPPTRSLTYRIIDF